MIDDEPSKFIKSALFYKKIWDKAGFCKARFPRQKFCKRLSASKLLGLVPMRMNPLHAPLSVFENLDTSLLSCTLLLKELSILKMILGVPLPVLTVLRALNHSPERLPMISKRFCAPCKRPLPSNLMWVPLLPKTLSSHQSCRPPPLPPD
jgi:hypothetical protein